ncbi:MAG: ABC-2 family transporter protein [Candidatus Dojkabacteria bacterium]|nr:ABC-2 family transporter protein [Candidatus Dojkabacteria bacterium]
MNLLVSLNSIMSFSLGFILIYFVNLILISLSFYIDNAHMFRDLVGTSIENFARIPLGTLHKILRVTMMVILPVAFVSFYQLNFLEMGNLFRSVFS